MNYQSLRRTSALQRQLAAGRGFRSSPAKSSHAPSSALQSRSVLPYLIGGAAGVALTGATAYAYYHYSGAKKVVERVTAAKDRYETAKVIIAEKGSGAQEKIDAVAEAAKEAAKEKMADIRERLAASRYGSKGERE